MRVSELARRADRAVGPCRSRSRLKSAAHCISDTPVFIGERSIKKKLISLMTSGDIDTQVGTVHLCLLIRERTQHGEIGQWDCDTSKQRSVPFVGWGRWIRCQLEQNIIDALEVN